MTFLDIALDCTRRGWYVFPCRGKVPVEMGGYKNASSEEARVREWWGALPDCNVGIAPGPSGLTVLDIDHGLRDEAHLRELLAAHDIPQTFAVRTGRRPEFAVQLYYSGPIPSVGRWELGDCKGDIRGIKGHVMAAGSLHPDSGEQYAVLWDLPIAPVPNRVRLLRARASERNIDPTAPITEWRNDTLYRVLCKHRANGADDEMLWDFALRAVAKMPNPLEEEEVERIIGNACKQPIGEPEPIAVIRTPVEPPKEKDWREHYHSSAEHDEVGPPCFLIEDFLPEQSIMGIGAFVGQKKTLAALNIVFSLCSGEALFGKYKVTRKPARVLYLGPENGLISFSDRVNRIGLRDYLCKTFFYATMSMPEKRPLTALLPEEVQDAAIVIDTAIRYTDGSENDAAMMKEFAEHAFSLIRNKAACVIMLHHSPKSMSKANELTLENSFRGTGELSAFLSVALAMRTQDMEKEYESASLFRFVKQRDFEPKPPSFEVTTSRETCRMTFVDGSAGAAVRLGNTANKDGKDDAAVSLLKANAKLSGVKMARLLSDSGIDRSKEWVRLKRGELGLAGVKTGSNLIDRKE